MQSVDRCPHAGGSVDAPRASAAAASQARRAASEAELSQGAIDQWIADVLGAPLATRQADPAAAVSH